MDEYGEIYQFPTSPNSVGCVNGIGTNLDSGIDMGLHLAFITNHNVTVTHAATFGLANDALRYTLGRRGIAGEAVKKIHENWNEHFNKNPGEYMFWECHSCGVVDTRNALLTFPKHLRERIVIVAVAPGCFISKHLCASVVHLVSSCDIVPRLDPIGCYINRDTIEVIKGRGLTDHYIRNPIYTPHVRRHFENFKIVR